MTDHDAREALEVTQTARDAAVAYGKYRLFSGGAADRIAAGEWDDHDLVQAFASYGASLPAPTPAAPGGEGDVMLHEAATDLLRAMHDDQRTVAYRLDLWNRLQDSLAPQPPAPGGDAVDMVAKIIDPDAWHDKLREDGCGAYWHGRRGKARDKAEKALEWYQSAVSAMRENTAEGERAYAELEADGGNRALDAMASREPDLAADQRSSMERLGEILRGSGYKPTQKYLGAAFLGYDYSRRYYAALANHSPDAGGVGEADPRWTALMNAQSSIASLEARLDRSNNALLALDEACREADDVGELYHTIDGSMLDEAKEAVAWKGPDALRPGLRAREE